MVAQAIPASFDELTPAWLTEALRMGGVLDDGATVKEVRYEPIGLGVGVLCLLARLFLTYDGDAPGAPRTLVAKIPSPNEQTRAMVNAFHFYEREVRFYREVADTVGLPTPRRYYTALDPETQDFILLLEDLGDRRLGDQLAGALPEEAALAISELARLHAPWWNAPELQRFAWMPTSNSPVNKAGLALYPQAWPIFRERFGADLPPRLQTVGERLTTAAFQILERFATGPQTICHGDYRIDNFFFGTAPGHAPLAVIDWQIVLRSAGPYDVGYFLSQSVAPALRQQLERDLLRQYHEALLAGGVRDYSFDQCLSDYRWTMLICFVYPVMGGAMADLGNERGRQLMQAMYERSATAILDWDADRLLDEL
jgi:aminoglycoside/choline kinase family phosphotransferase